MDKVWNLGCCMLGWKTEDVADRRLLRRIRQKKIVEFQKKLSEIFFSRKYFQNPNKGPAINIISYDILQHGGLSLMIVLRMVMAQEYSLSLHLSLASPAHAHWRETCCGAGDI